MAPELSIFMSEPLAVRPRAAGGARPLTRHGSQLRWHWALAARDSCRVRLDAPLYVEMALVVRQDAPYGFALSFTLGTSEIES
jgi:hypothetical protein